MRRWYIKNKASCLSMLAIFLFGVIFCLGGFLLEENVTAQTIVLSIGTSIVAAVIVTLLTKLGQISEEELANNIESIVDMAGIKSFYKRRDLEEYAVLLKDANDSVDVIGYSLGGFYGTSKEILDEKFKINPKFHVRILLVNPESAFSKQRDEEEHGKGSTQYIANYRTIIGWSKQNPAIEIRIIDRQISTMIFRIDDTMYIGPYLYQASSKETYTFKLKKEGEIFKTHQREFDKMWDMANVADS